MRELWSTEFQGSWEPFEIKCTVLQVLHYVCFVFACPALLFLFFSFFFRKTNALSFGEQPFLESTWFPLRLSEENSYWLGK